MTIGEDHHEDPEYWAQFTLQGMEKDNGELEDPWEFEFEKPKYAALAPLQVKAYDARIKRERTFYFTLLGNGVLELRMRGNALPEPFRVEGDAVFVGVHSKTRAHIVRDMNEADEEFKNYLLEKGKDPHDDSVLRFFQTIYPGLDDRNLESDDADTDEDEDDLDSDVDTDDGDTVADIEEAETDVDSDVINTND